MINKITPTEEKNNWWKSSDMKICTNLKFLCKRMIDCVYKTLGIRTISVKCPLISYFYYFFQRRNNNYHTEKGLPDKVCA